MHLSSSYPIGLVDEVTNETFDIGKGVYALADADNSIDDLSFLDDRFFVNTRLRRNATRFVSHQKSPGAFSPGAFYIDFNPAVWDLIKQRNGEMKATTDFHHACSVVLKQLKHRCSI